ncbi:MAG: helix-turn-helix transcriptional regulator [Clostridia bacterium]|nr:helix-turn-helix transcriptional regulator [Clostridia bacterium]
MNEACQEQWENLVKNLIRLRKENGLSLRKMAKLLGMGPLLLAKTERGEISLRLTVEIFFKIEEAFGISPSRMLSPWPEEKQEGDNLTL